MNSDAILFCVARRADRRLRRRRGGDAEHRPRGDLAAVHAGGRRRASSSCSAPTSSARRSSSSTSAARSSWSSSASCSPPRGRSSTCGSAPPSGPSPRPSACCSSRVLAVSLVQHRHGASSRGRRRRCPNSEQHRPGVARRQGSDARGRTSPALPTAASIAASRCIEPACRTCCPLKSSPFICWSC